MQPEQQTQHPSSSETDGTAEFHRDAAASEGRLRARCQRLLGQWKVDLGSEARERTTLDSRLSPNQWRDDHHDGGEQQQGGRGEIHDSSTGGARALMTCETL
jgi:hypothetical protein